MSADICVFQGNTLPAEEQKLLPGPVDKWYVGAFGGFAGVGDWLNEDIAGPYDTREAACTAMSAGVWLR